MSRVALLSGGVGGARAARGFAAILSPADLTVIVNVGDDDRIHGVHVSADLDTVVYTMAGREGPHGWGLSGDSFQVMDRLASFGVDTTFRLGDADLATCLARTVALDAGEPLSATTTRIAATLGVEHPVVPATDHPVRTRVCIPGGRWLAFQEYFVMRGHQDEVTAIRFEGADEAAPAPGVIEAILSADTVVIAPSNPPLSVWPILAVSGIRQAVEAADRVVAVSPLFAGAALKGPADKVMASLGLPPGNAGVLAAYEDLLTDLVVDRGDAGDVGRLSGAVAVHALDTRITDVEASARLAREIMGFA